MGSLISSRVGRAATLPVKLSASISSQPGIPRPRAVSTLERMKSFLRLAGRTAIVIAHRLRSAQRADRVVMVAEGTIIADGRHDELMESSEEYGRLVEVWQRGAA